MRCLLVLLLVLASGCDGAFVEESSISARVVSEGLQVSNARGETVYVDVFGEWAMIYVDPAPQTVERPGRAIASGETELFAFDADGLVRSDDDRFAVSWVTVDGDEIGERGWLDLER